MTVLDPIVGAKYLQQHGIPMLIEDILRELLTEKPAKPLPFIKSILNKADNSESSAPAPANVKGGTATADLEAQCAALQAQVAELQKTIVENGAKHADHVQSVRRLMADVTKAEIIHVGKLHAEHTASVRQMMGDVCKNELVKVGAIHADHSASVRSMMADVAKCQQIELGMKHADHTASVRAMMVEALAPKEPAPAE